MHIIRVNSTLRKSLLCCRQPSSATMKFKSSTVSAAALLSSCFSPFEGIQGWTAAPSNSYHRRSTKIMGQHNFFISARDFTSASTATTSLMASLMTESETDLTAFPNAPKIVARGSVVSFFRGGLLAVRIEEENFESTEGTPKVVGPPEVAAVKAASDTGADLLGHEVVFPNGDKGVVVAHRPPIIFAYSGMETFDAQDGTVQIMNRMAPVRVWDDVRVVDWAGNPIDKEVSDPGRLERAMFHPIPQLKDIALINSPVVAGTTMVDVLAPIGRGQNMLVISDDIDEARGMICDLISTQLHRVGNEHTKFVYAAIDDSQSVIEKLKEGGIANEVHIVQSDEKKRQADTEEAAKAAEATAMAATACAIAEAYAVGEGKNTVVIIDTLDQHKKFWDATTRVLVDVYGVDAVVKSDREGGASSEMRGFFSSIIQRSAQYKEKKGGGSVTLLLICTIPKAQDADEDAVYSESDFESGGEKVRARIQLLIKKGIPLTPANLRKIDIPIPSVSEGRRRLVLQHIDDLISMSDGQIWLDEDLRDAGQRPPVDPQRSITRIGIGADTKSRADAPAIRRVAEGLRLDFSQSANMDGAENTSASQKQARRRDALLLAMHQEAGKGGRKLSESCVVVLAASKGFLDEAMNAGNVAGTDSGRKIISDMLSHMWANAPEAMDSIDGSLDIEESTQETILDVLKSFFTSSY